MMLIFERDLHSVKLNQHAKYSILLMLFVFKSYCPDTHRADCLTSTTRVVSIEMNYRKPKDLYRHAGSTRRNRVTLIFDLLT